MLLFNLRERGVECGVSVSVLPIVGAERSEGKGRGGEAGRHGVPLRNGPSLRRREKKDGGAFQENTGIPKYPEYRYPQIDGDKQETPN